MLGGARSGKSAFAQRQAENRAERQPESRDSALVYLATAQVFDDEMAARVTRHRGERGPRWQTVEVPLELAGAIDAHSRPETVLLVDCLTLWASNLMLGEHDIAGATRALVDAMARAPGPVVLVANEVGLGIVPDNALARRFRDVAGEINQAVAAAADSVVFVAAGLPLVMK